MKKRGADGVDATHMIRRWSEFILLLGVTIGLCVAVSTSPKHASGSQTPSITGRAASRTYQGFSGVFVTTLSESGSTTGRATSGPDGEYAIDGLPDGSYRVDFDLAGFDLFRRNHVRVRRGTPARVNATLSPSSICECIERVQPVPLARRGGQVVDQSDRPLPHAQLVAGSPVRAEVAYADGEGRFEVRLPINGTWPLTASDTGFSAVTLHVSAGPAAPILFKLKNSATASVPDTNHFSRGCRCSGDLFTHEGR